MQSAPSGRSVLGISGVHLSAPWPRVPSMSQSPRWKYRPPHSSIPSDLLGASFETETEVFDESHSSLQRNHIFRLCFQTSLTSDFHFSPSLTFFKSFIAFKIAGAVFVFVIIQKEKRIKELIDPLSISWRITCGKRDLLNLFPCSWKLIKMCRHLVGLGVLSSLNPLLTWLASCFSLKT